MKISKIMLALAAASTAGPAMTSTARAKAMAPVAATSTVIASTVAALPNEVSPLKIGLKLPQITLRDSAGASYELTKSLAKGPALLVFYRGGWCPYCNAQLAGLSKIEPELLRMGYRIFAISPDSPADLSKTVDKHKLSYKLLSDPKLQAISAMGLAYRVDTETIGQYKDHGIDLSKSGYMLPVPAVYLVGSDGVVNFSYANPDYKTRVPEALILSAAHIFAPQK